MWAIKPRCYSCGFEIPRGARNDIRRSRIMALKAEEQKTLTKAIEFCIIDTYSKNHMNIEHRIRAHSIEGVGNSLGKYVSIQERNTLMALPVGRTYRDFWPMVDIEKRDRSEYEVIDRRP